MVSQAPYKIVAISGSLRSGSLNTALLHSLSALRPQSRVAEFQFVEYKGLPIYDGDIEAASGAPDIAK